MGLFIPYRTAEKLKIARNNAIGIIPKSTTSKEILKGIKEHEKQEISARYLKDNFSRCYALDGLAQGYAMLLGDKNKNKSIEYCLELERIAKLMGMQLFIVRAQIIRAYCTYHIGFPKESMDILNQILSTRGIPDKLKNDATNVLWNIQQKMADELQGIYEV